MTVPDVAEALDVEVTKVRQYLREGKLLALRPMKRARGAGLCANRLPSRPSQSFTPPTLGGVPEPCLRAGALARRG